MTNNLEAYRYYSLGVEKAQALQNPEAIELLKRAIALDPEFAMAYARIGYTYAVSWGRVDEAKPYLEKAFKLTDRLSEKDKLNIAAWYAIANLDYAAAIRSFQEILARYPLEVEGYLRLGKLLRGEERPAEAIEVLKQGLVIDSGAKDLYNGLGAVYSDMGRHDEAIAMFRRYVQLAPDEPNAHDSLGMGYQWAGRYQEAVQEYQRALTLKPDFEVSVIHRANTLFQQGHYREAIKEFQHCIETAPSPELRARGYNSIAHIRRTRGRLDEAERAAKQATTYDALHVDQLFLAALGKGDLAAAEKFKRIFERMRHTDRGARGDSRELLYHQGLFNLRSGRSAEAIENFKEGLKHRAPVWNIDAYEDCLANAYLELGRFDEAITEYNRVLKLNPNYPLVHYHLGQANERKGRENQARAEYERFLQVWSDADADIPEVIAANKALLRESGR
jgi:tetratricopeptide (TPR) repeat protein